MSTDNITKPMKKVVKKDWLFRQACRKLKYLPKPLSPDDEEKLEKPLEIDAIVKILGTKNVTALLYSMDGLLRERSDCQERKEKLEACGMKDTVSKDLFEKIVWLEDLPLIQEMLGHGKALPPFDKTILVYAMRNEVVENQYDLFHLLATVGLERFGGTDRLKSALLEALSAIMNSRVSGCFHCFVTCFGVEFTLKSLAQFNQKEEAIRAVYNEL